jgi:sugar lactone lactonase YvrE
VDIPESITTDVAGNLYASNGGTILRRPPGGTFSEFGTLPLPIFALGVKVGPDGCVYNASTSLSDVAGAFVWRICAPDEVEMFAELDPTGGPNDLAFGDDGDLFVTDPVLGRIWQVDPSGNATVFVQDPLLAGDPSSPALLFRPLGANGIALDAQGRKLYVSNTDQGTIVRIDVSGGSHTPSVFAADPLLRGSDGIAFDHSGTLFVALNGADAVVTVDHQARVRVFDQGAPLDSPSSIVFGATQADHHRMYVMSSAFSRTLGLEPGTPAPALLAYAASTPGLPLP